MTMNDEIIVMWIEFFANVMGWSMIIAIASFIISGILLLFSKLLKTKNVFLDICAFVFVYIGEVLACISFAAAVLMIIPVIPGILKQFKMYLR